MKLSGLSLIYVALSAFMAASILVVHVSYADTESMEWAAPLSLSHVIPARADAADTAMLWRPASEIEM